MPKTEVTMTAGEALDFANSELLALWNLMMWAHETADSPLYSDAAGTAARALIEAGEVNMSRRRLIEPFLAMKIDPTSVHERRDPVTGWQERLLPAERLDNLRALLQAALTVIEENMAMAAQDDFFAGREYDALAFETMMRLCDQAQHTWTATEGLYLPPLAEANEDDGEPE